MLEVQVDFYIIHTSDLLVWFLVTLMVTRLQDLMVITYLHQEMMQWVQFVSLLVGLL